MANQDHLRILKQGVKVWNEWRKQNYGFVADLTTIPDELKGANLSEVNFMNTNLDWTNLWKSDLSKANLSYTGFMRTNLLEANLNESNLSRSTLVGAFLEEATLKKAILRETNLTKADLSGANLFEANLEGANLSKALLDRTNLMGANVRTLAHLSRFIIADLTDPSSIPQELQAIVPTLAVPVQPVLLEGK